MQVFLPYYRVEECLQQLRQVLESGWTGNGPKVKEFEGEWSKYTLLPHSCMLNSATAGLHLAVRIFKDAYGWQDGDEIITTPLTFVSTNHAILYERLFPVFADVNPDTLCLDPASIEARITTRTRAVMYVGIGGNPGQLEEVRALCKRKGLKLILDAAHMAGTKISGRHVGSEADVAIFSFQSVKNLPTADGGMICFQDAEFDAKARKLAWLGIDKDTYLRSGQGGTYKWKYDIPEIGFKYHSNDICAAMGLVALKYLDSDNNRRRQIAHGYSQKLKLNGIKVHNQSFANDGIEQSSHLFQIAIPNRDKVLAELNKMDIYPGVHYVDNTHYRMYRHGMDTCPVAHKLSDELLTLPIHLGVTDEDVDRVVDMLKIAIDVTNGTQPN